MAVKTHEPPETAKKPRKSRGNVKNPPGTSKNAKEAPPADIPFTQDELLASLCRDSFFDFVKSFWSVIVPEKPVWNWHIEFICQELQTLAEDVFAGKPRKYDLVINVPPGSTKSTLCSVMFPAWVWTRMPTARVISATYAYHLATEFSRKSRDVILSELYQRIYPNIKLRDDQNAKNNYLNTYGGERFATGVNGVILGKHAHFIIVDDPLTPNQSVSDLEMANTNRWMEETLPSRKVDKEVTPTVLIMQRLAENDPSGERLSKADRMPVRHICLPAELTDDVRPVEVRTRYVDGLLDPVRLGERALAEAELQGDVVYSAQYLESPIPRGMALFLVANLKVEPPAKKFKQIVRFWDKASILGGGAYTVGTKMGLDEDGRYCVMDVCRVQLDTGRRERLIKRTATEDGRKVRIGIEEEPGSGGKHSAESTVKNLAGYTAMAYKVGRSDGDKEQRADAFSAQVNIGNVYLTPGPWNKDFIHELRFFPRSKYKDQVDSAAGAFNMLANRRYKIGALGGKSA